MVVTMASLPDVIGLLYRADWTRLSLSALPADWTRLSLSADIRFETDRDLAQRRQRGPGCPLKGRLRRYQGRPA
jgi:hypothetical protein